MIATGSEVAVPEVPGLADVPCWTSDDVLDLSFLPERVIILGGESWPANWLNSSTESAVKSLSFNAARIYSNKCPEAASITIENVFREEGIDLYTDTSLHSVSHADGLFRIVFEKERKTVEWKRHTCSMRWVGYRTRFTPRSGRNRNQAERAHCLQ